ncbi:MAG: AAA family ATPase [Candidatus Peribacteraceae bacterium]|nr:AAA family ATPase [Candidatus Peribacteraceae bacterium]
MKSPFLREVNLKVKPDNLTEFPFSIPSLHEGNLHLDFTAPITFFAGENGSGKSTVMEAIAVGCGFNPSGGSKNNVYDYKPTESSLANQLRLSWNFKMTHGFFLRAESFFNFATHIDDLREGPGGGNAYEPYGGQSLHEKSHGESFMALFENRFKSGIYLLDEPEAALSPKRQLVFLARLHELLKSGESQFIIATHSPILLSYPGAQIYSFNENGVTPIEYKETEHFQVTKDFLNAHEGFYKHLLSTENEIT